MRFATASKVDLDKINNQPVGEAAEAMYRLLETLQDEAPHVQLLAPALLIRIVGDILDVDLQRLMQIVSNMEHDERHGQAEHFRAMREYVKFELGKAHD